MILSHYLFNHPLDFDECNLQQLVFESSSDLGRIIGELYSQIEGGVGSFALFEGDHEVSLNNVYLSLDPFSLELDSKDIVTGFIKSLFKELNSFEFIEERDSVVSHFQSLVARAIAEIDPEWTFDGLDLKGLLKIMGLHPTGGLSLIEQIAEFVRLTKKYTTVPLVIFVNYAAYLSEQDYLAMIKQVGYYQVPVVMIESKYIEGFRRSCIFDKDFCQIDVAKDGNIFEV